MFKAFIERWKTQSVPAADEQLSNQGYSLENTL